MFTNGKLRPRRMRADGLSFKPIHAKALVLALGLLVFTVDMAVPADLNVAIFYSFVIILCAWTRSVTFLWSTAAVFAVLAIPGLLFSPPPVTGPISWVDETNQVFAIGAVFLVAAVIHFRMRIFQVLEDTIISRKKTEKELRQSGARLRLAQTAGRIGSWEWNPVHDVYQWSQECCDIFGFDCDEKLFATKWSTNIDSTDRAALQSAMNRSGILAGIDAKRMNTLWAPFVLFNVGCAGRVALQVLTDFIPNVAYPLIGFTGFVELFALLWWGIALWRTMNLAAKGRPSSMTVPFPMPAR